MSGRFRITGVFALVVAFATFAPIAAHAACNGPNNGVVDGSEECETGACCDTSTCTRRTPSTVCRASAGNAICDPAETCGVTSNAVAVGCPADGFASAGTVCEIDATVCTSHTCNSTGQCIHADTTLPCEDGSFCTVGDTCSGGSCVGGAARDCSDPNLCTTDSCNEAGDVCVHVNNTLPCDDSLYCTVGDICGAGICTGTARNCSDSNTCTNDACDEGGDVCSHVDNTSACSDGQFCTVGDTCNAGVCVGSSRDCGDANACTNDACNEATDLCTHANNADPCDDGLYCTISDACSAGTCTGAARDCGDANVCTTDSCNDLSDQCDHANNTASCDDGLFCTTGDTCAGGSCASGPALACSDANACTDDSCDEGANACAYAPNAGPCDNGSFCDGADTCSGGACTVHAGDPCSGGECADACNETADNCFDSSGVACSTDGNTCTDDVCNGAGSCGHPANSAPCEDGMYCTVGDTCAAGSCASGPARNCSDANACTNDSCDEGADTCAYASNTGPCDNGNFCDGLDTCAGGACTVHAGDPCTGGAECADSCNEAADNCYLSEGTACTGDGNGCTADACDGAGSCAHEPTTAACDDGLFCNGADTCSAGACTVHAGSPCQGDCVGSCDEGTDACNFDPVDTACSDDGTVCTANVCDGSGTCLHPPVAGPCDDANGCTVDDQCSAGSCSGTAPMFEDLCSWTVLMDSGADDPAKLGFGSTVDGNVCGGLVIVRGNVEITGNVVSAGASAGTATLRLDTDAIVSEDMVTAGADAKSKPGETILPYATVRQVAGGTTLAKDDASGFYDTTGSHPLAGECLAARAGFAVATADLDILHTTLAVVPTSIPSINVAGDGFATVTALMPGEINIIDIPGIKTGSSSTVEINGGGSADTVVVLRVATRVQIRAGSSVVLSGGLTARNVLLYVEDGSFDIGDEVVGAGTVIVGNGRLRTGRGVTWDGAFFDSGKLLKFGDSTSITHTPFQGF